MNEHSPKFERVKMWYDTMRWTKEMVANVVVNGRITADEYQEITGDMYTAPAVQPSGSETGITERMQTMETRFDAQEGAINDLLISVIPELLGGE